jgi:ABC-type multidrug transport system ATPase subunit
MDLTASSDLITVTSLTKKYGALKALDNVGFSLPRGKLVALLGPNGAGKTTCFKCLLGITPFEGRITIDGFDVASQGKQVRSRIGYVPQSPDIGFPGTCYDHLAFLAELRGVKESAIEPALRTVRLWDQGGTDISKLSGGMRQRLALAGALLSDPPVLLLDEPTASMDATSQLQFHDLVKELRDAGKTLLVATHYVNRLVDILDLVLLLDGGELAYFGKPGRLLDPLGRRELRRNGHHSWSIEDSLALAGEAPSLVIADELHPRVSRVREEELVI